MSKKYIWIVGKSGVLSKEFQELFAELSIEHVVTCRKECDVTSERDVEKMFSLYPITHVMNCSAYTAVDLAEKETDQAVLLNVKAPLFLGRIAKKNEAKCIHFSTDYVFNGKNKAPYLEEDIPDPLSIYGKTKLEGEIALLKENPGALIIRTSWLFSKDGPSFARAMIRAMLKSKSLSVVTDQIGCPTSASALAKATMDILEEKGVFHFVNGPALSRYAYAAWIRNQLMKIGAPLLCEYIDEVQTIPAIGVAIRPMYSVLATDKIERKLKSPIQNYEELLSPIISHLVDLELGLCLKH